MTEEFIDTYARQRGLPDAEKPKKAKPAKGKKAKSTKKAKAKAKS
jgi:hypothetical protein